MRCERRACAASRHDATWPVFPGASSRPASRLPCRRDLFRSTATPRDTPTPAGELSSDDVAAEPCSRAPCSVLRAPSAGDGEWRGGRLVVPPADGRRSRREARAATRGASRVVPPPPTSEFTADETHVGRGPPLPQKSSPAQWKGQPHPRAIGRPHDDADSGPARPLRSRNIKRRRMRVRTIVVIT
jgi:hypothetical protein